MDCEACTERLIDLLYQEIDDADAQSMRAHLDGCEACAGALERLRAGREFASFLAIEEPPPAVREHVMRAARERATERSSKLEIEPAPAAAVPRDGAAASGPRADDEDGLWSAIVRWLGGLAMGPQVAMAMMLLLMVGVGMWYLPELRPGDPSDSHAIVDPSPGDEVGPSGGLEPAQPLDLEADPRTGRIRPRDSQAREEPAVSPRAPSEETPEAATDAHRGVAHSDEAPPASPPAVQPPGGGEVIAEPLDDPSPTLGEIELADGEAIAPSDAPELRTAPQEEQSHGLSAVIRPPAPAASDADGLPAMDETAAAPPATTEARYERGMDRYRQRDYGGAADDLSAVVERPDTDARRLLPSALHHLARSQRASGDCARAIPTYERLLGQHRTHAGAPAAMIEVADCYRRTGQISRARSWLEQASRDARVASQAQRELARIEAIERGQDRATTAGTEASTPAP